MRRIGYVEAQSVRINMPYISLNFNMKATWKELVTWYMYYWYVDPFTKNFSWSYKWVHIAISARQKGRKLGPWLAILAIPHNLLFSELWKVGTLSMKDSTLGSKYGYFHISTPRGLIWGVKTPFVCKICIFSPFWGVFYTNSDHYWRLFTIWI